MKHVYQLEGQQLRLLLSDIETIIRLSKEEAPEIWLRAFEIHDKICYWLEEPTVEVED